MASPVSVNDGDLRTPVGDAPIVPLFLIGLGAYLMWFGVHYWRDSAVVWPSDPIKAVLQGKGLPSGTPATTAAATLTAFEKNVPAGSSATAGSATPATSSKAAANRARLTAGVGTGAGRRVP